MSHWYLSGVTGTYKESLEPVRSHWNLSGVTGTYQESLVSVRSHRYLFPKFVFSVVHVNFTILPNY